MPILLASEIAWVAGILEGEGSFRYRNGPVIQLHMTDEDVVVKAKNIMKADATISSYQRGINKRAYQLGIYGCTAIQWMMTIYPLMGKRRQAKIREILGVWKVSRSHRLKRVA